MSPHDASIDRRIRVIRGSSEQRESLRRVSDLRVLPYVVLLGEPGIGKSTVFGTEAAHEGVPVLTVRQIATGLKQPPLGTLFVDALDEYRADGDRADKADNLASVLLKAGLSRWRLSCRSEDWRQDADLRPLRDAAGGAEIVVVVLLPLDRNEAAAVLRALGEDHPARFLVNADAMGATGFTQSPLSLKLLHKVAAQGAKWPSTRYDLFAAAVDQLAHEHDDRQHQWNRQRASPDAIVDAAGIACLTMLVCGARAAWAPNSPPPLDAVDRRAHITAHDAGIDRQLWHDMLDTALFRGDGASFEGMHRTIAEYLAARALARIAVGDRDRAALPLPRAIALITGPDGGPPTELRGLYAWSAAHLSKLGDEAGAMRLITTDAVSVLVYGDAAAFGTPARRAILASLDLNDPYFRESEDGEDTAVGGLAGDDLAADFGAILSEPSDGTHRMMTVFEALTRGPAVSSLRPLLRSVALDPARPDWQRRRAADAWLNGADNVEDARRGLFDALAGEPVSTSREALRIHLAGALGPATLGVQGIKSLLADFHRSPKDNTVGRLVKLQGLFAADPPVALFDEPLDTWLPPTRERHHRVEVDHFLDRVLAASIRRTPNLTARRLWRWIVNGSDHGLPRPGNETKQALAAWLDENQSREVDLFSAIVADDQPGQGPWVAGNLFLALTGRHPSAAVVRHLLLASSEATQEAAARHLLRIAVWSARLPTSDVAAYWEVHDRVSSRPRCKAILRELTLCEFDKWRLHESRRKCKAVRTRLKQRARNVQILAPLTAELRVGQETCHLRWAAQHYFRPEQEGQPPGLQAVAYLTDTPIAEAIAAGWEYLATRDLVGVDAAKLGVSEAGSERYCAVDAAVAGLDRLFNDGRLPPFGTMPICVALAVLQGAWIVEDAGRRRRLEQWASDRLNEDPAAGAAQLLEFWGAALDAGATQLAALWTLARNGEPNEALSRALDVLLDVRPSMPADALRSAIQAAAKQLARSRFQQLTESALANVAITGAQRAIWSIVGFGLDPFAHGERIMALGGADAEAIFDQDFSGLVDLFEDADESSSALRHLVTVRRLGRECAPDHEMASVRATRPSRLSAVIRQATNALAGNPCAEAGAALERLFNEPGLSAWWPDLRHARAQQARLRRDRTFRHPDPLQLRAAINHGPPVNACDLRAIVVEELERLRAELRTSDTTPWKRYWNVDSKGKVTKPLIENECRDNLLVRLQDRLSRYHIAGALPEARRGQETRADMLVLTGAGRNLPVEAKRHFHAHVWEAASTQLQGYAADQGADGYGIYLVFWFGNAAGPTPSRPDGGDGPMSAEELQAMLIADLPPEIRSTTDVIVFDVSDPAEDRASPRRKRARKAAGVREQSNGNQAGQEVQR